jgi:hypothetical protein
MKINCTHIKNFDYLFIVFYFKHFKFKKIGEKNGKTNK